MRRFLGTFAAIYGIGYLSYMLMPALIGSLIEGLGINEDGAGLIATTELVALAVTLLVLAPRMARMRLRTLAFTGAGLAIAGSALATLVVALPLLAASRAIAGVGMGMCIAAANAVIAASESPQRLFAGVFSIGQLQAAVLMTLIPVFTTRWAHVGGYGFVAVWFALMMCMLVWLPRDRVAAPDGSAEQERSSLGVFFLPSVVGMILVGGCDGMLWTFTERIAESLALDAQTIGLVLGGALVCGVLGAAFSAWLGERFGVVKPIAIALPILGACYLAVTFATTPTVYAVAQLSVLFSFGFVIPYLLGFNGSLDPKGRVMVAASGAMLAGMAIGPAVSGAIIVAAGFKAVGACVVVMIGLCLTLFMLAARGVGSALLPEGAAETTDGKIDADREPPRE
jgi:MFS family permease